MGKRRGPIASAALLRHIESCKHKYLTVEELVEHLRSNYPHYSRQKLLPLTSAVKRTIELINSKEDRSSDTTLSSSAMDEDETGRPSQKKQMKLANQSEEGLEQLEIQHIQKRRKVFDQEYGGLSMQSETSSSKEDDVVISTFEDAIYEKRLGPKSDLVKSMPSKDVVKLKSRVEVEKKSVEMESNKAAMKVDLLGGNSNLGMIKGKEKSLVDISHEQGGVKKGTRFSDLGGMTKIVEELKENVLIPILNPHLYEYVGGSPDTGILLHGPPGCGKTKLVDAIAFESGLPFYKISGVSGASEENIRLLFEKAYRTAPSIVFIDEIDVIASKRDNLQREMDKRIVTQLMTCMDIKHSSSDNPPYVLVIGATNRPDSIDPALRRPGRFDCEIALGVPDEKARLEILTVLSRKLRLGGSFDLLKIARSTPGFVASDLVQLRKKAAQLAVKKIRNKKEAECQKEPATCDCIEKEHADGDCTEKEPADDEWKKHFPSHPEYLKSFYVTMTDFEEAIKMVQPSTKREGFSTIPNVKWVDVGGMELIRQEFLHSIVRRIKYPDDYKRFNFDTEKGFLLYGPPGCGKTLIAKAVANESGANFIHIKGPDLLSKYVGESEMAVRTIFRRARTCSPCIIFFDEVDALTTNRGNEGGWVVERLLNQLLIELDGGDERKDVYVIAATNRPEVLDSALLRPKRLGKQLHVRLPSPDARGSILKALARDKPIDPSVDLLEVGKDTACDNYSGADLSALLNLAARTAFDESISSSGVFTINRRHFDIAFQNTFPSVSQKEIRFYDEWSKNKEVNKRRCR